MLRRLLGLVLVIAAHGDQPAVSAEGSPEVVTAGGISSAQEAELHRLLQATSEAIQELPAGHRSKDKLRLLHVKLESLRAASGDAEEHEWDAMVQALLDSTEYGSAQVEALLQARGGAAAPACDADDADSADGAGATVGRRLQEAEEAVDARSRAEVAGAPTGARGLLEAWAAAATAALARRALARRWEAWKRWMLDRPPPWERDCDCCYAHCPEHLNCLVPGGRSGHGPHMAATTRERIRAPRPQPASRTTGMCRGATLCLATQACCNQTSSTSRAAATRSGRCSASSGPSGPARSWGAHC